MESLLAQRGRLCAPIQQPRVVLASLPWATFGEPSLGLATLKATLVQAGITSRVMHLNLGLLRHVSAQTYSMLAAMWGINEFLFTHTLDPRFDEAQAECLVERCRLHAGEVRDERYRSVDALVGLCMHLREDIVPRYLAECVDEILAFEPTLIGLSCMFDQTLPSVAMARLLREKTSATIVLGGYALEGAPGDNILRSFPWIDAVARGDGEPVIARLAQASVGNGALQEIPGVITQARPYAGAPAKADLNANPVPDYRDWFLDLQALELRDRVTVRSTVLPVEASRGCWWGQNKHCVFCGIDEDTLKYRAKDPERVLEMLDEARERFGEHTFRFSDYILPKRYYEDLLGELSRTRPRFRLMGEIKANQTPERLQRFANAGFIELQPGIESFSSEVLALMDKGVRGIYNVGTLKSGYVSGVQINYNLLYGLPGEQARWYQEMLRQLPKLYHLTPPVSRTETIVTRFAPLQADSARFGVRRKPRHHRCYDVLFSREIQRQLPFALDDHAYYFDRYFDYGPELQQLYLMLVLQVETWKRQHRESDIYLSYRDDPVQARLVIADSRFGQPEQSVLDGLQRMVYLACDHAPTTLAQVARTCAAAGVHADDAEIEAVVDLLSEDLRILWREGNHVLGLAAPESTCAAHRSTQWPREWTANYC